MVEGKTEKSKEMNSLSLEEGRESHGIQKNDGNDCTESQHERYNKIPPWSKQITARGLFASLVIGSMYSLIVMKLVLTTGLVPTLNVSAALVAFLFLRIWSKLLNKLGFITTPFTKQENTVVQTCAVACYTISMGGKKPVLFIHVFLTSFSSISSFYNFESFYFSGSCRWIWILHAWTEQENIYAGWD